MKWLWILNCLSFLHLPKSVLWLPCSCRNEWHCCCCCWVPQSCLTHCDSIDCPTPGFPVLDHLPEFAQTQVHWVGDAIQPSCPLLPLSPALDLSQHQGLFQWVDSLHQVAKVLELQLHLQSLQLVFSVISFRIDWFDLLVVYHNSKVSVLQCSVYLIVQLSHLYMTNGKTIALTR